jgi:hypothetical protein
VTNNRLNPRHQTELSLSGQNSALARRCLLACDYRADLVRDDIPLPGDRKGLVGFAHRPFDARSACIVVLPSGQLPGNDVTLCREIGAALFFTAGETRWDAWAQMRAQPKHLCSLGVGEIENYFRRKRQEFAPSTIFRAKTWFRAGVGRQLDFVDTGLLPVLERETGARLLDLFERMVAVTMNSLGWDAVPDVEDEAHWLTKANFWLLAAKLLHDKRVVRFANLDTQDVRMVFDRVGVHYNREHPDPPKLNGRIRALQEAARFAAASPHFSNISAETLGMLYEEALINPITRKLLGTHRAPTYLVDYMLAGLSGWIEELGYARCHIFEPGCGHAPFLSGALRLVSDMLPASIADEQKQRHDFLRARLRGYDNDPFSLEIARLCLTLADIPNENGWVLERVDMFAGTALADEARSATLVLANPPYEREQAAAFLQRIVPALRPGTIFGFVLPVNELTGSACAAVRRQLLAEFEIKQISVFPDRMFKFASVETGIVLGRKHESKRTVVSSGILFRRVRESKMNDFRERYDDSWREKVEANWLRAANAGRFVVPELHRVWDVCQSLPKFKQFAAIGQGLIHRSKKDPRFPQGATTESKEKLTGLVEGFASIDDSPETHLQPSVWWLNLDKRTIRRPVAGTTIGLPQVVMNYAPVDRDIWRMKAFIDPVGRPATSRMLLIRPKRPSLPLACLWAFCNSPIANAYTFAMGSKRDIPAGLMRGMPVPDFNNCDLLRLHNAASNYLEAAREFTKKFQASMLNAKSRSVKSQKSSTDGQMRLGLSNEPAEEEIAAARDRLRALHWRADAEVLRLYALPPELERELLDGFDGVMRVGVPFEQTRYISRDFRDVLTLDEFLQITDEWDATEARRCLLIQKRINGGRRTPAEEAEFRYLQRLLTLRRRFFSPLPTAEIKALAKKFKEEGEWAIDH